jgi:hypothetical protein
MEKVKSLKLENKKLVNLLRDSERLFYQKLQDTKKEVQTMVALFKQLWPLIKSKVKDPNVLLKTISVISGNSNGSNSSELINQIEEVLNQNQNSLQDNQIETMTQQIGELSNKVVLYKKREKIMRE